MQQNQQDAQGQIQQMQQGQVLMQQQIEAAIQQSHQEVLNLSQALQGMHQQMQQQTAAQVPVPGSPPQSPQIVLSKPSTYDPVKSPGYAAFNDWSDHVITCVDAQIPGTWELLEHIKDTQPAAQVSIDDLSLHFPNIDRATLEYLNSTLYAVLITFTVGEARNIVRQARRPNGYEAWKLLQRRFNPVTIGRQRAGLTTIANPPANVPLAQLAGEIVSWETKITEFEARPHAEKISEAIKMAAVVSMCPNRLREHLQLNAQRYTTYMELREEIFTYIEHTQSLTATSMDIGSLQSKGSGKGGGCFECGGPLSQLQSEYARRAVEDFQKINSGSNAGQAVQRSPQSSVVGALSSASSVLGPSASQAQQLVGGITIKRLSALSSRRAKRARGSGAGSSADGQGTEQNAVLSNVDSGAAMAVCPPGTFPDYPVLARESEEELVLVAANEETVEHNGEVRPIVMSAEGHLREMVFQVAAVGKVLTDISSSDLQPRASDCLGVGG
ncbi:Retrovirus-related Pol polyprotein from transposon TNT 1-94 [Durusdinium trenchii]|uniref:Retrovirus-related Pol polyprotein from transposon TNT 1-94 n=1 Tax=Durusdinium trenchii TaxID=1381693 RepID=A0ABP0JGN4_9DINO